LQCLIIAAGQGKRLATLGDSKPLVPIGGRPLIEWVILAAQKADLQDIVVVTGYNSIKLTSFLNQLSRRENLKIKTVLNDEWEKENGISVLKAKDHIQDKFILLMADHLFAGTILPRLINQSGGGNGLLLAVDFQIKSQPNVDLNDVTRVLVKAGQIKAIGKHLTDFNAFDTGIFLCTPLLFSALKKSGQMGNNSLSGGVQILADQGKAGTMDVDGSFWIDVDDEAALNKAERFLPQIL
jgi:choline kinase